MPGSYDIILLTSSYIHKIEIAGLAGILIIADIMAQIVFQQFFIFIPARRNLDIIDTGPNGFRGGIGDAKTVRLPCVTNICKVPALSSTTM